MSAPSTVFLDRDGTVNVKRDGDYVRTADALQLLPGAACAVARLNRAGVRVVLVTNQRGVARGLMSEADLDAVHDRLGELLATHGAHVDAVYACLHETGACACRKPLTGLVLQAARDHPSIDLSASAVVGDADSDIALGAALDLPTVLLRAGGEPVGCRPTHVAPDLPAAVDWLLGPRS